MVFVDASALVKRYVRERHSVKVRRLVAAGPVAVSRLSEVEVPSALARLVRERRLSTPARDRAVTAFVTDLAAWHAVEAFDHAGDRATAGMNIEGAVKLGYREELMAIEDPEARLVEFQRRTATAYDRAEAVNAAARDGIDDVIDLADTRDWVASGLRLPPAPARTGKKYPYIDPW